MNSFLLFKVKEQFHCCTLYMYIKEKEILNKTQLNFVYNCVYYHGCFITSNQSAVRPTN